MSTLRARLATTCVLGLLSAQLAPAVIRASTARDLSDDLFPHRRGDRIVFSVEAPSDAEVFLVGEFNDWDATATRMHEVGDGVWEVAIPLEPGEYQYKFVVNGRRALDAANPDEVSGADGSINSRIEVLPSGRVSERSHWQRHAHRRTDWSYSPDDRQNFTRFVLLRTTDPARAYQPKDDRKAWKTSLVFTVRNVPGALFRALSAFALRDINLAKIESRPLRGKPWEYLFYLDFMGHLDDERTRNALGHLRELADFLRVLGCYPRGD